MKVKVEIEVNKETHELAEAVASIVSSIKAKSKDGLTAVEVAAALTENVGKILAAVDGIEKVGQEWKDDPQASVLAMALLGAQVMAALLPTEAPVPSGAV